MNNIYKGLFLPFFLLIIISCDSTKRDWEKADEANSVDAIKTFMAKHPGSKYDSIAVRTIDELQWKQTETENSLVAVIQYLDQNSDAKYRADAIKKLRSFSQQKPANANEFGLYEQFITKHADDVEINSIQVRTEVGSHWFSSADIDTNFISGFEKKK